MHCRERERGAIGVEGSVPFFLSFLVSVLDPALLGTAAAPRKATTASHSPTDLPTQPFVQSKKHPQAGPSPSLNPPLPFRPRSSNGTETEFTLAVQSIPRMSISRPPEKKRGREKKKGGKGGKGPWLAYELLSLLLYDSVPIVYLYL